MRHLRLDPEVRRWLGLGLSAAAAAYLFCLAAWLLLWQTAGDASRWLFTLNALAIYLFVPLPFALAAAVWRRNLPLIAGSMVAAAVFVWLWGGLFWPNGHPEPEGPVLTVMTYNLLGSNQHAEEIVEALRDSDADIIGLSELNLTVAAAIERELAEDYPYRVLTPQEGVTGGGVISRFPINTSPHGLEDAYWASQPDVLDVEFEGVHLLFVRAHSSSGSSRFEDRERQAQLIADLAATTQLPLIVVGDFNALDTNESYRVLTGHLYDAWRQAGSGLGNTFPGASRDDSPGSKRPNLLGIDLPQWLIRIDYVFCSYDWQPIDARIGPWDGYSDHRPVIAEVALRQQGYGGSS
jgi:endonuclease/exonuclease/phosphatase (EEP) superfamily protein YafD